MAIYDDDWFNANTIIHYNRWYFDWIQICLVLCWNILQQVIMGKEERLYCFIQYLPSYSINWFTTIINPAWNNMYIIVKWLKLPAMLFRPCLLNLKALVQNLLLRPTIWKLKMNSSKQISAMELIHYGLLYMWRTKDSIYAK